MKREFIKFQIVMTSDSHDRRPSFRCYPTPEGAAREWARYVVSDLMRKYRHRYLVDFPKVDWELENSMYKRLQKKAFRRALPIFEKALSNERP
jgi:hypothetical protein